MSRSLAVVLALVLGINGLTMLSASFWWYNAAPGVIATGAYNSHFVRDIGAVYLMCGGGLAWFAWRPAQGWPAVVAAATFLVLHAAIHVFDATCSPNVIGNLLRDLPGVFTPAIVAAALALFAKPREA